MIRKAVKEDAAQIALLIIAAMGNLAQQFRASAKQDEVIALFEYFVGLRGNQYSFENTLVYISSNKVVGAVNAYDGGLIEELRKPFHPPISSVNSAISVAQKTLCNRSRHFLSSSRIHLRCNLWI